MKRIFYCAIILVLAAGAVVLAGCKTAKSVAEPVQTAQATAEPTPTLTPEPTPEPVFYGADVSQSAVDFESNWMNAPSFYYDLGWIYGQTWDKSGYPVFVKVRADYSEGYVLDKGMPSNVVVNDGYIYYRMLNSMDDYGIYRMRLSGDGKELVVKAFGEFQIVGDQLFYADQIYQFSDEFAQSDSLTVKASECHLMRSNPDGTNAVEIIAKPVFYFYVIGSDILYQDDNDDSALHVCGVDGTGDRKIADGYAYGPVYDGEYVYYYRQIDPNDETTCGIWRVHPDGTGEEMVAKRTVSGGILLRGDAIYYVNADDSGRVYRINKDGTGDTLITQDAYVSGIQFLGEGLKYSTHTSDFSSYTGNFFCGLDGTNKKQFNP